MRLLLVFLLVLSVSDAAGLPLIEPRILRSSDAAWSATLTVQAARYNDGVLSFTGRQYCTDDNVCTFPGPTLELKPNDVFHLTVVNRLGPNPVDLISKSGMDMSGAGTGIGSAAARTPNTTNMHTHGLHISPLVDSIFLDIAPGETRTYVYHVPANHAPGLHWYHAHQHTTTTLQVMGGLHGAILVSDPNNNANLPASYTAMTKHLLVLSHLQFAQLRINGEISQGCAEGAGCTVAQGCASNATDSPFSLFRSYSYTELSNELGSDLHTDPTFVGGAPVNQYVVNGQFQPSISMTAGEYSVLRVVHTGGAHTVEWQAPSGCSMTLLAIDGVFLTSTQDKTLVRMTQAGRWEIMTVCAMVGKYAINITFGEVPRIQQTLLTLEVTDAMSGGDGSMKMTTPVSSGELAAIHRPDYLSDLRGNFVAPFTFAVHFGHLPGRSPSSCGQWLGSGSDCSSVWKMQTVASDNPAGNTCPFQLFPGSQGGNGTDPWEATRTYKHVTPVGAVNEWKIYGMGVDMGSMGNMGNMGMGMGMTMSEVDTHPFHMHAHHVQVIGFTSSSPAALNTVDWREFFTVGEWRDTLPSLDGELVVRFAASHFAGETIFHCHVLRHEDIGMMSSFYVCDPLSPNACPPGVMQRLAPTNHASARAQAGWTLLLALWAIAVLLY